MAAKVYVFQVEMMCDGCSGAVDRVLRKMIGRGVEDVDIDLKSQQVSVTSSSLSSEELLEIIKKTGKNSTYIGEKS